MNILLRMLLGSFIMVGTILVFLLLLESACRPRDEDDKEDRGGEDGT